MNLEALALARAEEQLACRGKDLPRNPSWRAAKKPKRYKGRVLACECGTCPLCRKRDWQRRWRAKRKKSPRICSVEGCLKHVHKGDLCERHDWQMATWGTVFPNRRRVASQEFVERARERLAARGIDVDAA